MERHDTQRPVYGKNIRSKRRAQDMTMAELGRLCAVTGSQIGHYESGRCVPPLDVAIRIAKALNCSMDELCAE